MSGELPFQPSSHDVAAASAVARAHGRGLGARGAHHPRRPAARVKGRGRARTRRSGPQEDAASLKSLAAQGPGPFG
jgi:hypothetical protein